MKILLATILLLLPAYCMAVTRHKAIPQLHSIFDQAPQSDERSPAVYSIQTQLSETKYFGYSNHSSEKVETGIMLLSIGCTFIVAAGVCAYASQKQIDDYHKLPNATSDAGVGMGYALLGLVCLGVGLTLGFPGLHMIRKYSSGGRHGY